MMVRPAVSSAQRAGRSVLLLYKQTNKRQQAAVIQIFIRVLVGRLIFELARLIVTNSLNFA